MSTSQTMAEGTLAAERLEAGSHEPLFLQIYQALRADILAGHLASGQRLAATRALARDLGVSRNTVLQAFDQLMAEGYVEARVGSGTYVARNLPEASLASEAASRRPTAIRRPVRVSTFARRLASLEVPTGLVARPFQPGVPDVAPFPWRVWQRIVKQQLEGLPVDAFGYGSVIGHPPLRRAIAHHLRSTRGIDCSADQVLVVGGAQQGLDLVARVLLDAGDSAWVEDPGYPATRTALAAAHIELVPVPVDDDGLVVAAGRARGPGARAVFVTPSHQYPLGSVLCSGRRLELLAWARESDAWVVEDDYDSEYRYRCRPLQALKALDDDDRVIYLGTLSKVMFPALRIGFIVAPVGLVDAFAAARYVTNRQGAVLEQAATAAFFEEGHFMRHLRRMRVRYERRQDALIRAADEHLTGLLTLAPSPAGLHLVGWLPPGTDEEAVARAAADHAVAVVPLARFRVERSLASGLVLGYAAVADDDIAPAARRLADAIRSVVG